MRINVINGPNINIKRKLYNNHSLRDIEELCLSVGREIGVDLEFFQSNHEGEIVEYIQGISSQGIVINVAAYTHTSIAILDALLVMDQPIVEVHISNIFAREEFRKKSYISQVAQAVISGMGIYGYKFAIQYLSHLRKKVR